MMYLHATTRTLIRHEFAISTSLLTIFNSLSSTNAHAEPIMIFGNQLIRSYILSNILLGKACLHFYKNNFPELLADTPLLYKLINVGHALPLFISFLDNI